MSAPTMWRWVVGDVPPLGEWQLSRQKRYWPRFCGNTHPIAALDVVFWAGPEPRLCEIEVQGSVYVDDGVVLADEWRVLRQLPDVLPVLLEVARLCALDVAPLWDAPEVVRDYLRTGDESLRDVARIAAKAGQMEPWQQLQALHQPSDSAAYRAGHASMATFHALYAKWTRIERTIQSARRALTGGFRDRIESRVERAVSTL